MKSYIVIGSNETRVYNIMKEVPIMGRVKGIDRIWGFNITEVEHNLSRDDIGQDAAVVIKIENEDPWIIEGRIHDYTNNTITVDISDMVDLI